MILVKCPPFIFQFTYRRERATECKSKEQSFKRRNYFYQSKQFRHSSWAGGSTPEDAFLGWRTWLLPCRHAMMSTNWRIFFSGLIKEVYQEENWVMMTWTFYLPAKMPMKNDKKVPHCISNLFKKIQQTLLLIVSCIKCLPGLNGYSPKTGSKYSLAKTVWKMNHLSELVTFLFHTWRETQKKNRNIFSLYQSPLKSD